MSLFLNISHLSFEYDSATEPLFRDLSLQFAPGWTGIVGANGSGKSTLLKLLTGHLKPDSGNITTSGLTTLCEQEVTCPPAELITLFTANDKYAFLLQDNLSLTEEMSQRWTTLSMGERKKLQIATALHQRPDILALDEPTNHLDTHARDLLLRELKKFRGIGIIISHDRELLDRLCNQCLFLESGAATLRSGNFSSGRDQKQQEVENHINEYQQLKKELKRQKQELQRRREKEQQARNKDCKRKLDRHDHDGKGRIDAARVTGRDRRQGDLAKSQANNVTQTQAQLSTLGRGKIAKYGLKIPYGEFAQIDQIMELPSGILTLGEERSLVYPELALHSQDRVAITGNNGAGKSTLLRKIVAGLKLPSERILYMPQELSDRETAEIYRQIHELPREDFSKVMNVVSSLGSRPEQVLDSQTCSPGEWRKLFFGLGVLRKINLIIMDEPTNHLDLPSIECLEAALKSCQSAMILISHDQVFLHNLCNIHWNITIGDAGQESGLSRLQKGYY